VKVWQVISVLLLFLVLVGSAACNPFGGGNEEEVSQQRVEVVRGDLMVSISGSGNVEVANEAELTFGVSGKIEKIRVKEGDRVSKSDVLAKLDTGALELALTQAQLGETQAEVGITQAQAGLITVEVGVTQAKLSLETAKYNLDRMEDVAEVKDDITDAEYEVKIAEMRLKEANYLGEDGGTATQYWRTELLAAQLKLAEAQADLAELLAEDEYASLVVDEVIIKQLQVESARQALEQAQQAREQAQQTLKLAHQSLAVAQQSLEQTQKQLDEAIITAPFDGIIAGVSADEGDTVSTITIIVHLIDLTSVELKVEVDEIDIPGVKPGQKAILEVDALPTLLLEGEVTFVSHLAKEEGGVVLYKAKISFGVPEDSGIKAGMSATADIVIDERSNVLLVPSRAVNQDSRGNSVVKVMVNEEFEERPVVIGISDGFQTEIVEGLQEGDAVVLETRAKPR